MSKYYILWYLTNGIGSLTFAIFVNYVVALKNKIDGMHEKINSLTLKLTKLEEYISLLEDKFEDVDTENISPSEIDINKNTKQLEEYILSNYEFIE